MKKMLLLGGSAQQVIAIETAKRLGYYTVLCDYLPDNPGQYHANKFYLVSTTDKEAVLSVAKEEMVNGVIAYASDPAAPTAAYVAEQLGLPGSPYSSVEILCNKDKFRAFLKNHNFCTPEAKGYLDVETAFADLRNGYFKFPLMVKPVDSSGSKGVGRIDTVDEAKDRLTYAMSFSRVKRIIVEEYIEKKHPYLIGGDIFVINGKIAMWGLMNCHRNNRVNPLVPVGKSYPLELNSADTTRVKITLQSIVDKLEIKNGAMNVELIIDKADRVWPIDIGPRCGGNMIPDLLGMIFDTDIVELSVKAAMGQDLEYITFGKECGRYFATHNLHTDKRGIYGGIKFSDELEKYIIKKKIYKKTGDEVEPFTDASKVLGVVFMRFSEQREMMTVLEKMTDFYKVLEK